MALVNRSGHGLSGRATVDKEATYAATTESENEGGWRTVETIQDRDNLASWYKKEGMAVWVKQENKLYQLISDQWVERPGFLGEGTSSSVSSSLPEGVVWLMPSDSLQEAISNGAKVINLVNGQNYANWQGVTLNTAVTINGNGAKVLFSNKSTHGWLITASDCKIKDVNFVGSAASGDAYASYSNYWAIKVKNEQYQHIVGCSFDKFSGGIGMVGQDSDYYNGATNIESNLFTNCFCGVYRVGRFEFGRDLNNRFYKCVIAIFDMAGNWTTVGAKATACRIPYLTADWVMAFQADGVAAASSNNGHGTLVACEFNHANNMNPYHTNYEIPLQGSGSKTLTNGMWISGAAAQPPTMMALTCYYCNITIENNVKGYGNDVQPIRIAGIVGSSMTINNQSTNTSLIVSDLVKRSNVNISGNVKVIDYVENQGSSSVDTSNFATKSEISSLASKTEVSNKVDISTYNQSLETIRQMNTALSNKVSIEQYNQLLQLLQEIKENGGSGDIDIPEELPEGGGGSGEIDVPSDITKTWKWLELTTEDFTDLHSLGDRTSPMEGTTFKVKKSEQNDGVLFNTDVMGIEFDVTNTTQFATFGIISKEEDGQYWTLLNGWATSNANVRESWLKTPLDGTWGVNNAGSVASGINWGGNYTVGNGAHVKIYKDGDDVKFSCTNNNYANHKNIEEHTITVPSTGNFQFGLTLPNGGNNVTADITNIKVYKYSE